MLFKKKNTIKIISAEESIKNDVLISKLEEKEIKNALEGASINILLGAGFTANLYRPLVNIEEIYTYVEKINNEHLKDIIMWKFFEQSIYPMSDLSIENKGLQVTFFKILRELLSRRGNPVKNKQVNIFTTNYDLVPEIAIEHLNMDYNDGFKGKIYPVFSTANYGNILIKNLISTNNKTEIESINLYKLHGSLTWRSGVNVNTEFMFNSDAIIKNIYDEYSFKFKKDEFDKLVKLVDKNDTEELSKVRTAGQGFFRKLINTFNIIWPTKEKFHNTVMNMNNYELLRIFSNELEKNQSLLIVFGFSFNDEHILEIVKRSLSNPTLLVYVFCYKSSDADEIFRKFENCQNFNKIKFIYDDKDCFGLEKFNNLLQKMYS